MLEFQNRQVYLPDGAPVIVSRILGSIDGSTFTQFEEKLLGFRDQGITHLILVFSQVTYISSSGMGILVKIADKFQECGGDICLINVPDKLVALFNMLGLLSLIKLSDSESEALERFQKQRTGELPAAGKQPKKQPSSSSTRSHSSRRPPAKPPLTSQKTQPKPAPEPASSPTKPPTKPASQATGEKKPVVIRCKKCATKISLGAKPRAGSYRCPRCRAVFKLFSTGKIRYL